MNYLNITELPDIITVEEMASFLRIGRNAAYKMIQGNEIAYVRIGRTIRIPRRAIEEFINKSA